MRKKILLFLLVATYLLVTNSQTTPTPTMSFNATYGATNNFIIQSPFQYKWVQAFPDATTSKIRQTFMNSLGTSNKTQFQLAITGSIQPITISAFNYTCAIIKEVSTGTFSSYLLDSAGQTISLFNNMSYIADLSSIVVEGSNFSITQNCKALKINTKIYHYNIGNSQYVQDVLPFTFTQDVMYDPQLSMLINNGDIYNYNTTTSVYQFQRADNITSKGQFIRSDTYPDRVIISTGAMVQNKIVFNISINVFKNGQLIKIKQFKDQSFMIPVFLNDRSLSRIFYTVKTSTGATKINGLFINYRMATVSYMLIPSAFYSFTSHPFVLITQNYLYIRQVSDSITNCRQFIMQFLGNQILVIKQNNYTQNQNFGFKRAVIQQRDTQISVFLQMETEPFMYVISQMVYGKISSQPTIPNAPDPNLFSFTYPGGVNLLRSSVNPRWMYLEFDGTTSTTITAQLFVIGETANKITITDTQTGNWNILGGTDVTFNCAVAFDSINNLAKVFYYNQTTRTGEIKADVTAILAAENVADPSTVQFDVSDKCKFFKIGTSIYHYNGTQYLRVILLDNQSVPTNFTNAAFDETFQTAVINGTIYQYYEPDNRYYSIYTPTQPFLQDKQIFLNVDKLIILSSITNYTPTQPISSYRIDCLWSNGTNWTNIDVSLEGGSIYGPPGIQISPNFQIFGIGGIKPDGSPFIYGKYVQYRSIVEFQNATVKQITIPSEMMYNNQIPYVRLSDNYLYYRRLPSVSTPIPQNHEAFYQIDKSNGLLKFINKRNLTVDEQLIWKNTFVKQINSSMVVFYETQDANTVKLTQRLIGNANGGGAPTANIVESDTGVLLIGNKTYMCSVGCSSCLTANSCEECAEGFALDSVSLSCKRCKGSCKACAPSDASTCTSCFPGTFLSVDSCLPCGSTCVECDILANNCTACKPGMILTNGACSACPLSNCVNCQDASTCLKCRPGFALNSSNLCVQCTSSCSQCDPANVLTCLACRDGFELNTTSTKCIKCPDHCKVCVNQVCSECNNNFRVTSSGKCAKKCEFPCMSCSDTNPSSCLSCSGQYVLSSNRCIPNSNCNATAACQKCAVGYILFQGVCYPCQAGNTCKQCDLADPTLCLSCVKGYYLDQASICTACPAQCSGCETAQSCTSCKDGYTLPADSTTSQCLACESPCQTCISSTTNCLTCVSGYKLQGWKCRSKINIEWVFELNIVFSSVTTTDILAILDAIATLLGIPIDSITLMDAYSGSTVLSGSSDASTAADVSAGLTSLSTASAGTTLGGFPVVSSTFTGNDGSSISTEQSSNSLTIALAVAIPVIIITAIIIAIILYKKGLIFAKSVAISQQIQLQSQDNINIMNLKEFKMSNNQFKQVSNQSRDPITFE